jgi:hypothetical protein
MNRSVLIASVILTLTCNSVTFGQGFINGSQLYVQSGATLNVDMSFDNLTSSAVHNNGTISITGDLNNSGVQNIDKLVVLDGTSAQSVTGNTRFTGVFEIDKSGGTATVTSGTVLIDSILRLNTGIINANGNVVIVSDASGTGLVDDFSAPSYTGTVSGQLRVQRYITGASGFHYIGSPVNTPDMAAQLSELNLYGPNNNQVLPSPTCDPDQLYFGSPYGNAFEWREVGPFPGPSGWAPSCEQWGWFVRSSGPMTNGRGYSAIASIHQTIEIAGTANTSEISTVTYGGLGNTNPVGDGWHLVSNPFPSPIKWSVGNVPAGIDGGIAFWQPSGTYAGTYQPFIPLDNKVIGSMQGFFVHVSSGTASWSLPQSTRVLGDPGFYKPNHLNAFDIVVEAGGFADKTTVRFGEEGESNGFDSMLDALKIPSRYAQPTLQTRIGRDFYAINSLPIEGHPMTVPMDLTPGVSGTFKFRAEHLSSFDIEAHVYLEDLKVGKIQELTINPVYEFTADENDDAERFLLHFRLNGEDPMYTGEDILMYANNGSAYVFLPEFDGKAQFDVFNALGDLVYTKSNLYEGKNTVDLSQLATGAYVFRLMVNDKPFSKKVIL